MLITPVRPVVPNVGRNAVTPQRAAGYVTEPAVSDPIANGTIPAVKYVLFICSHGTYISKNEADFEEQHGMYFIL